MTVQLGSGIKPAKGAKLEAKFLPLFGAHEELLLLIKSSNFRFDHVAVTTERVIGCTGQTTYLATFPVELSLSAPLSIRIDFAKRSAELKGAGKAMKLKMLHPDDLPLLRETLRTLQAGGAPVEVDDNQGEAGSKMVRRREELRRRIDERHGLADRHSDWPKTAVVGGHLSLKATDAIREQCHDADPWLILVSSAGAGLLVAWDDRMSIIKTGALTSFMAGSLGGQRTATFHFRDITGLEYNSGIVSGVLEVLTPSYGGTSNKDYWRGSSSSRNANSDDPWTLSNTLPLDKSEYRAAHAQFLELRRRVSEAKAGGGSAAATPAPAAPSTHAARGVTEELSRLAALYEAGILSPEEFSQAKQIVLGSSEQ